MNDTIVAISSPVKPGIRGIIRLSGKESFAITQQRFSCTIPKSHTHLTGKFFIAAWQEWIDTTLYIMPGPKSYTGEDIIEIHTFSSPALLELIIKDCLTLGARIADPGEFTKRAFLAGKIDLAQVEAIQKLIEAGSETERQQAIVGITGKLSSQIQKIRQILSEVIAVLEAYIDFVDEDIGPIPTERLSALVSQAAVSLQRISKGQLTSSQETTVVLYGKPNAGKSTLFNQLVSDTKAITSHHAGTTLDWLEGTNELNGYPFRFLDTAGIMMDATGIQAKAQEKARELVKGAQILLFMVDSSAPLSSNSFDILPHLPEARKVLLASKSDLEVAWNASEIPEDVGFSKILSVSYNQDESLTKLKSTIVEIAKEIYDQQETCLLNLRQTHSVQKAIELVQNAKLSIEHSASLELIAIDLRVALDYIGEVVGAVTTEDILEQIFSTFCIGK